MFTNGFKSTSIAFAITLFSTASYSWLADSPNEFQHCGCPSKKQLNSAHHFPSGSCQVRAANQSWLSWLTGNSRSSQFHYLDLLELLESGKQKSQSNYTSHIH